MDIPIFHLDLLNNRSLIAIIASIHVVVNHALAVGGIPLVAYLEWRGLRDPEVDWDTLAYRILKTFFLITTTVGAMTGVGIWLSASLVNPYAIGSLIRVFFWTWFVEWLVFVTEVALILAYFLTWKKWIGPKKVAHAKLGRVLAVASWVTMALIVSILSFMMDPGAWQSDRTLFSGMLNPLYLPQLAFRTPLAMVMAGAAANLVVLAITDRGTILRERAVRAISGWTLLWILPCLLGGALYASRVPSAMAANLPVAMLTQQLAAWSRSATYILVGAVVLVFACSALGFHRPSRANRWTMVAPAVLCVLLVGTFERVREFVRKPYAIAGYLYSNGIRKDDYPMLQRDGLLAHATYTTVRHVDANNEVEAGREVFRLACTRCHTSVGVNSIRDNVARMYGEDGQWDRDALDGYIGTMHMARPFMPPFPGSPAERKALASYIVYLQHHRDAVEGAQTIGATSPPFEPRKTEEPRAEIAPDARRTP